MCIFFTTILLKKNLKMRRKKNWKFVFIISQHRLKKFIVLRSTLQGYISPSCLLKESLKKMKKNCISLNFLDKNLENLKIFQNLNGKIIRIWFLFLLFSKAFYNEKSHKTDDFGQFHEKKLMLDTWNWKIWT